MTPQERAEKIVDEMFEHLSPAMTLLYRDKIAFHIEEAEREAKDWCMMQHAKLRRETWEADGFKKGFRAAQEKAVKLGARQRKNEK